MRVKGTELEKYTKGNGRIGGGRGRGKGRAHAPSLGFDDTPVPGRGGGSKASKWRQQSSQFREAIRQVRIASEGRSLRTY